MARLLITGASGLLGANLAYLAAPSHDVVAVSGRSQLRLDGALCVSADLSADGSVRALLEQHRPQWVVHCAAATDLERCEREPEWAHALNVELPRAVAAACHATGARLAHLSTDSVFDGEKQAGYVEQDQPRPVNVYARTKWLGEQAVQQACPGALIVRTNFFGWTVLQRHSLAEWFLDRLERAMPTPGFADVFFSPLAVDHLAGLLLELLAGQAEGLLHLPGATCLSKYDFGVRLARTFGHDTALVQRSSIGESKLKIRRPLCTCLNGEQAEAVLGRPLPDVEEGLGLLGSTRRERMALRDAQPYREEFAHESD